MSKDKHKREHDPVLPPIMATTVDIRSLSQLANSSMTLFPRVAHFLSRETDRANAAADGSDFRGVARINDNSDHRQIELVSSFKA